MRSVTRWLRNGARRYPALPRAGLGVAAMAVTASAAAVLAGALTGAPAASAAAQSNPVAPAMMKAMSQGTTRIVAARAGASPMARTSEVTAQSAAMTWLRFRPGSRVLGESLAYASTPLLGQHRLVWLVSVDPAGGLYSVHPPAREANFVVELIDASSGRWLMTLAGRSAALPRLPVIR